MAEAYTLHIVPHTHWDREWYFTLEEYRYRLVRLVDTLLRCLDEGSIEVFTFDGQTIAMEDYLAVRPEQRDKLAQVYRRRPYPGGAMVYPAEHLYVRRGGAGTEPAARACGYGGLGRRHGANQLPAGSIWL